MQRKTLRCPICGREFIRDSGTRRYCSSECSLESTRRRMREYYKMRKERMPKKPPKPRHPSYVDLDYEAQIAVAALTDEQRMHLVELFATEKSWSKLKREGGWV